MTDSQINALLEIFQARMQKVVDEYLTRMGQQVREIGEIIPSDQTRLVQLKKMEANIAYIQRKIAEAANESLEDIARTFEAIAEDNARTFNVHFFCFVMHFKSQNEPKNSAGKCPRKRGRESDSFDMHFRNSENSI